MIEVIFEMLIYIFVDVIFGGIILGIFKGVHSIGLIVLKLITFSNKSIQELKEKYKDSSKPYFLGFLIAIGTIYLLIKLIT